MQVKIQNEYHKIHKLKRNDILTNICFSASLGSPRDLTTEEMRKLLERNEVVQGGGGPGLQPFDTVNV